MRLHHLSLTAFGPYAGTEVVDFDALNDAGVFLLSGPMGAGKTTILDAICFALYGVVPGERGVKTLRSHHAAPTARPEVVLEVTLRDRRYRVRRSPEWHRPKRRGEGSTKEQASATLTELVDGTERVLSSRIAEVGHELGSALQMSSEQFMQVVLLPQGGFQTFLRATSDERQAVLERLFGTARFARIEDWVREHTKDLGQAAVLGERRVHELVSTLAHQTGSRPPAAASPDAGAQPIGPVETRTVSAWAQGLLQDARARHELARREQDIADRRSTEAEAARRTAEHRAALLDRRRRAEAELRELAEAEPDAARLRDAVAAHERAAVVTALLAPLDTALSQDRRSARRLEEAARAASRTVLPSGPPPPDLPDPAADGDDETDTALLGPWSEHARELSGRLAHLRRLLPREAALGDVQDRLSAAEAGLATVTRRADEATARLGRLPDRQDRLRAELVAARAGAAALPDALEALGAARRRLEAARDLPTAALHLDALAERSRAARDRASTAREHHLDLVERRLRGMAAELAGELSSGGPCQVCGSTVHPRPAEPGVGAVTEEQQRLALEDHERLRVRAERLVEEVSEATRRVDALTTAAGGLTEARAAVDADGCLQVAELARAEADRLPTVEAELSALHREQEGLRRLLDGLSVEQRNGAEEVARLRAQEEAVRTELTAVLGGAPLAEAVLTHQQAAAVAEEVVAALEARAATRRRLREAARQALGAATARGFGSVEAARGALLGDDAAQEARASVDAHQARRQVAEAVLAELAGTDEGDPGDPCDIAPAETDLEAARRRVEEAGAGARRCHRELVEAAGLLASLEQLVVGLEEALTAWEPTRAAHGTAATLCELVRGRGADNQLQMRLSSYVLATRLDQVLDAANARLAAMRECRYTLRRTGEVHGNRRAGLGVEVLDEWTGQARATGTLSGGETFVLSLALALGLADVVTCESGGVRVDTLFVDEGFGMLDQETLDDVMDQVDALRAGGRTVGVVSHVTELRARIPVQLQVTGGRDGSRLTLRTLVA